MLVSYSVFRLSLELGFRFNYFHKENRRNCFFRFLSNCPFIRHCCCFHLFFVQLAVPPRQHNITEKYLNQLPKNVTLNDQWCCHFRDVHNISFTKKSKVSSWNELLENLSRKQIEMAKNVALKYIIKNWSLWVNVYLKLPQPIDTIIP